MLARTAWILAIALGLWSPALTAAEEAKPFFFLQLTDPQFGMCADNADFQQETANFEFAIATANRLRPAFVIVTGDLVNKAGDKAQIDEYLRICGKLDRGIRLYHVPGNHDLGTDAASAAAYESHFGPDHYSFRQGSLAGIVLNSNLIASPQGERTERQEAWLKGELEKAVKENVRHVVVFQHHPLFLKAADEPKDYFNVPQPQRGRLLALFQQHRVGQVFAGHYHSNQVAKAGTLEMITTGPIGKPMRGDSSGMRAVIVRESGIEHRYYPMGDIPNRIELAPPKPAAKTPGAAK
jgi:3',5'-cyclic AMP phosphodiesterase CpdA